MAPRPDRRPHAGPAVRRALARLRWAGIGLVRDAADPEPEPLRAAATPAPQVSLTVIHVEAGAQLIIGGAVFSAGTVPAVPQHRAVTATTITEGEPDEQVQRSRI